LIFRLFLLGRALRGGDRADETGHGQRRRAPDSQSEHKYLPRLALGRPI
jgi:hypothetical protein